jgi:hypothetical protein
MLGTASATSGLRLLADAPHPFAELVDRAVLDEALRSAIPDLAVGAAELVGVEPRRMRLGEGRCTGSYDLTMRDPDGLERTVRLVGSVGSTSGRTPPVTPEVPIGAPGWRCWIPRLRLVLASPPSDDALPALPVLTDPERARRLLESVLRSRPSASGRERLARCRPTVVRYKAGSRCTVLYELDLEPGTGDSPARVVAKTYRGGKGRIAFEGMRALWDSPLRDAREVRIAEPLAFVDPLNALVQTAVPGSASLKELVRSRASDEEARRVRRVAGRAGAGLARLHSSGARAARRVTWSDGMDEVRGRVARLASWVPGIERAVEPVLSALDELAARCPPGPFVPSHQSFRPAQVLVDGEAVSLIDFDGYCAAEPALDLALFRATVRSLAIRSGNGRGAPVAAPDGEDVCASFLGGYGPGAEVRARVDLWEALDLLVNVLNDWRKVRPERTAGDLALLQRQLDAVGLR